MADEQEDQPKPQFPPDANAYKLLGEIGVGVSAVVHKAECLTNSTIVAIKAIDLDRTKADFDDFRREAKTMSLLSHPNILNAHCSFTVDRRLWVIMPFMSAGSLQSIISSAFPDGLPEQCIAVVLKETLNALSYLHNQGHLHRDIKAGNILIDSNGSVKLADFGVSASIYEWSSGYACGSASSSSSTLTFTDVAGTPYWMAPEVIHSHRGYSFKADIWSFGITAMELAHGRPPLSHLPLSKSLLVSITKRFRFSDYENKPDSKNKKFSKAFKDMVASCLNQDPAKRPTAERLLKHYFFKNCRGGDSLVRNILKGLPSVEERFKSVSRSLPKNGDDEEEEDDDVSSSSPSTRQRRISGWNFNEDGFELDPVFPTDPPILVPTELEDDMIVKRVRFGGETIIQDFDLFDAPGDESAEAGQPSDQSNVGSSSGQTGARNDEETQVEVGDDEGRQSQVEGAPTGEGPSFDPNVVLAGLMTLRRSLEEQRQSVSNLIAQFAGGETSREEQLVQTVEFLRLELENERAKSFELEMEVEFLKLQISGGQHNAGSD